MCLLKTTLESAYVLMSSCVCERVTEEGKEGKRGRREEERTSNNYICLEQEQYKVDSNVFHIMKV